MKEAMKKLVNLMLKLKFMIVLILLTMKFSWSFETEQRKAVVENNAS
jgi:hypothetical protein